MSKGALPLPYIVALIFAIIVVAAVAYLFFTGVWEFPWVTEQQKCEAMKLRYCNDWKTAGEEPSGGWDGYAPGCRDYEVAVDSSDDCSRIGIIIS